VSSVSLMLCGVCVALFLGVALLNLLGVVGRQQAVSTMGLSYVGIVQRHWLHQFLTAPLMHGGISHLLFNMLSLWMLGPGIEEKLGRGRYVVFSILCAASSMAGFLLFNWGTGNIVVGYSGVIFGILVAQAVFFPNNVIAIYAFFPLKMKYAVLLFAGVELYLTLSPEQGGGVAHAAHLFGALAAFVYIKAAQWRLRRRTAAAARPAPPRVRRRIEQEVPREL
jgi:membrane associated rhomboid family serine protease